MSAFLWPGWSRERLQAHLGTVPQPLLHPWGRPQPGPLPRRTQTSQSEFLSQVGRTSVSLKLSMFVLPPRDLDQDANNSTHCANATFLTSRSGRNWRRGGWWHAGVASIIFLNCVSKPYFWTVVLNRNSQLHLSTIFLNCISASVNQLSDNATQAPNAPWRCQLPLQFTGDPLMFIKSLLVGKCLYKT